MINVKDIFNLLKENNVNCFCGVPDSLLKDLCAYISDNTTAKEHTITANEGNAVAFAAGHYMATGNPALVYMQNSGIGNCVNPLLSLTDEEVYNIPLLMFIGWRGEPDKKDEPQHIKQGKVTDKLLDSMNIKYSIMPDSFEEAKPLIQNAFQYMKNTNCPYAFIIKKGTFEKYSLSNKKQNLYSLCREFAIESVIKELKETDIIVSTTGHISREVYETRIRLGQSHKQDFLTVGSMGHSSSVALGIAIEKPNRNVYCFDGDGAFLMHMGALAVNASKGIKNFKHIVFNNEAHDSVGAQPTVINNASITGIALNAGYKKVFSAQNESELKNVLNDFISFDNTALLEIKVKCGAREDLGRPKEKPQENKKIFMDNLKQVSFVYNGAIENASKILNSENASDILVFCGKKSFEKIKNTFEKEVKNFKITYYNDFTTNPKAEEVEAAIKLNLKYDIIIAVGGGSVIDFAKSYKYYTKSDCKIIAIPTTCGTGSEATQFAVLYKNGKKISLDDKSLLPDYAIADSQFVINTPKYIKACTALDCFCQAIESYWAIKSTPLNKEYAAKAIKLCKNNIVEYVNNSLNYNEMMSASNYAGKAINISRTTAAHALSYAITTKYSIPHGHAVALSMKDLFNANIKVNPNNCNDIRGVDYVKKTLNEILELLDTDNFTSYWENLLKEIDVEYSLSKLNINDKDYIIQSVNTERLKNNPVNIDISKFWINY